MTLQEFDIKSGNLSWFNTNVKNVILECIDPVKNHRKFYRMKRLEEDKLRWQADYGRIGGFPLNKIYVESQKSMWDMKNEKLKKGYVIKAFQLFNEAWNNDFEDFLAELGDCDLFD